MKQKIFSYINKVGLYIEKIPIAGTRLKLLDKIFSHEYHYVDAINKIQKQINNSEKLKVVFLVTERTKWNAHKLYTLFEQSKQFEPYILVNRLPECHYGFNKINDNLKENYDFFVERYKNVELAYDDFKKKPISLKEFKPDIVFYQQPFGIYMNQTPETIHKEALTCYYSYGISVLDSSVDFLPFHEKLFRYYVPNQILLNSIKKYARTKVKNLKIVGYPKLEVYNEINIQNDTKTIIYAPHRSIHEKGIINIGTFNVTGIFILEFAKQHPEYNWIFKPHPRLRYDLQVSQLFDDNFAENYYKEWKKIGSVYDSGDYFKIFSNSDLLITDCDSFLIEYMPTLKPIIRLEKENGTPLSELGKNIVSGIYKVSDKQTFLETFNNVIINKKDNLFETRKKIVNEIIFDIKEPSRLIYQDLLQKKGD